MECFGFRTILHNHQITKFGFVHNLFYLLSMSCLPSTESNFVSTNSHTSVSFRTHRLDGSTLWSIWVALFMWIFQLVTKGCTQQKILENCGLYKFFWNLFSILKIVHINRLKKTHVCTSFYGIYFYFLKVYTSIDWNKLSFIQTLWDLFLFYEM